MLSGTLLDDISNNLPTLPAQVVDAGTAVVAGQQAHGYRFVWSQDGRNVIYWIGSDANQSAYPVR